MSRTTTVAKVVRCLMLAVGIALSAPFVPAAMATERAQLVWDTATDIDLFVYDSQGNEASFGNTTGIPDAVLSPDDTVGFGPETFTDNQSPSTRRFRYCANYFGGSGATPPNPPTTVTLTMTDPDGSQRTVRRTLNVGETVFLDSSPTGSPAQCGGAEEQPPVASTGDAAGVENDSVTLRGSVRPNGLDTTWFFEYGETTTYGRRTPTQTIPETTAEVPVSAEVSDLDSNSTYHYRLVAQNAAGTVTGPDRVFDTRKTRLSDLPRPVLGTTANVGPVRGKVFVSVPPRAGATRRLIEGPLAAAVPGLKGRRFIPLSEARQIPMGSLLDTRRGTVRVATARDRAARVQSARFLDGVFQVLQSRARKAKGLTELRLKGSSFSRCRTVGRGKPSSRRSGVEALASAGRTIRRLRGSGRGRFRTRGRRSAATVKGTIWTVSDRCDGTLTTVTRGRVAVRDFRRKKTIIVRAGKKYLAR